MIQYTSPNLRRGSPESFRGKYFWFHVVVSGSLALIISSFMESTDLEVESKSSSATKYDPESLPELLNVYYKRLFPYGLFYRWLNYGSTDRNFFSLREFSFTLKDDIYVRYQSFENQKDFEKSIQEKRPYKIDIGAVYSSRIIGKITNASTIAVQRELVFDIDMTDYDEVRLCCSAANICGKCWPLMTLAIKIIHRMLTEDFGFQNILWVYSGRRGIHCWVCDSKARNLSSHARSAIVEYISLIQGGNVGKARKVGLSSYAVNYNAISKSLILVRDHFHKNLIRDQNLMELEKGEEKVLSMIEDQTVVEKYKTAVKHLPGSENRWRKLSEIVEATKSDYPNASLQKFNLNKVLDEIAVQFCYPRLDINVSHGLNHLLKSPFSVHPKTGRICVPINPNSPDLFDPFKVPTVNQLNDEINAYDAENPQGLVEENPLPDWKKTGMQEGIQLFEKFVRKMEIARKRQKDVMEDSRMEF